MSVTKNERLDYTVKILNNFKWNELDFELMKIEFTTPDIVRSTCYHDFDYFNFHATSCLKLQDFRYYKLLLEILSHQHHIITLGSLNIFIMSAVCDIGYVCYGFKRFDAWNGGLCLEKWSFSYSLSGPAWKHKFTFAFPLYKGVSSN